MNEFRLAYPILLLLIPAGIYAFWRWRTPAGGLRYSDVRLVANLPESWRIKARFLPDVLRAFAWVLLVIALARPQTGNAVDVIRGEGVDIVLVVDISTSMAALDFEPQNRLEAAKVVIADFIAQREFDRIGLVVFARNAYHQAPLTLDYAVLLRLLDEIQLVSDLSGNQLDGTALGLGIASAANMLRDSDAPSKIIILLTDGDNNIGVDPLLAAEAAATLDMRIYTIGMGRPGVVNVPTREGDIIQMESDLNENNLRQIASIGNGLYFRAENTAGLQQIYNQINRLERSDAERRLFVRWQDRADVLLIPVLILLLTERVLRLTVFQVIP